MFKFLFCLFITLPTLAQKWTPVELASANTAASVTILSSEEKEVIRYINLARMYPVKFAELEVKNYTSPPEYEETLKNSPYKKSLYTYLQTLKPLTPLQFDPEMYELAKCFARESGRSGYVGHDRKTCKDGGLMGECCDYGNDTGKEIALSLLIDHDVPSLGHRFICLSPQYKGVGVKMDTHLKYRHCAVLDFK